MNHVERFERVMNFEPVDRLSMIEWADYWTRRWRASATIIRAGA